MRLYFYCIVQDYRGGDLPAHGVHDQRIFQIRSGDLFAAVSASPVMRYEPSDRHLREHRQVIDAYMGAYPILPFRFNTIVGESVGRGVLRRYHAELLRDLRRVQGHIQFSLRVVRPAPGDPAAHLGSLLSPSELKARMRAYLGPPSAPRKTYVLKRHVYVREIRTPLAGLSTEHVSDPPQGRSQVINDHYLVPLPRAGRFQAALTVLRDRFPELQFTADGPLPPYEFHSTHIMLGNTPPERRRGHRSLATLPRSGQETSQR